MQETDKHCPVLLIDAFAWIFRSYYGLPDFRNDDGEPTAAVHGFLTTILRLENLLRLETGRIPKVAVIFDIGGPQRRLAAYSEYKANRPKTPDDLKRQIPHIQSILSAANVSTGGIEGEEADDVIACTAVEYEKKGVQVYIASNDKDFFQILSDRICMVRPARPGKSEDFFIFDISRLEKKFGLGPESMVDYYSLVGDSSDNVPGVKGIGDKTAQKLMSSYKTLEDIYDCIDDLPPRLIKLLNAGKDNAFLSRDLIKLNLTLKVTTKPAEIRKDRFDSELLESILTKLNLKRLKSELLQAGKE